MFSSDLFFKKIIIVTGGRSGIGFSISKLFLKLGAKVIIASRSESQIKKAVKELSSYGKPYGHQCDIRDLESVNRFSDWIKNKFKIVDILVNNAGGQFPSTVKIDLSKNTKLFFDLTQISLFNAKTEERI